MKNLFILCLATALFTLIALPSQAQNHDGTFGNEWIDYNLDYYKIKVVKDGMHRVSSNTLQNLGISLTATDPNHFQVFEMGQEIPIYVHAPTGTIEYIEFFGKKNRGDFDINLYQNPSHHFNKQYSAITDTSAYFLTINSAAASPLRFAPSNVQFGSPLQTHFMYEATRVLSANHNKGKYHQISTEQLTKSTFEFGEGFGGAKKSSDTLWVATPSIYAAGGNALVTTRVFLLGIDSHFVKTSINNTVVLNQTVVHPTYGEKHIVTDVAGSFSNTLLTGSGFNVVKIDPDNTIADQVHVAHSTIRYPRAFDFGGAASFEFTVAGNSSGTTYFEISNFNGSGFSVTNPTIYLYDLTNNMRIECFYNTSTGKLSASLPPSSTNADRHLIVANYGTSSGYQPVGLIQALGKFTDYPSLDYVDYLIVSHNSLRNSTSGTDPVLDYAGFRASSGFTPYIFDIEELYNQFSYGINYHPSAVRNFANYAKTNWTNPEYLFLIGKGRGYDATRGLKPDNLKIPTFGYPYSDNLLVAEPNSCVPSIAVGRLSASTADQVALYLNKMQELESQVVVDQTIEGTGWTKNILHLGGGKNDGEQNTIKNHLNSMKVTAEDIHYGANVESFFKTSSNPIQAAQSDYLDSLINSGVSMITFFGHSSANSFDFNLDYPSNYTNHEKYPLIMALGCYGGGMYGNNVGISERFVFEPDAGASVFLASVGASALSALNLFAQRYYSNFSFSQYGEGAAKSVREAISNLAVSGDTAQTHVMMVCHYMSYHGDPAFNLNAHEDPDYFIDDPLVSHSPEIVTTQMTEFTLSIDVHNLGRAANEEFYVTVERIYSDGDTALVAKRLMTAPYHSDVLNLLLPVEGENPSALGLNEFTITIDSDDEIDERPLPDAENNNQVIKYAIHILSDEIIPVYPQEFAIVPDKNITLKASTGNIFAPSQAYVVQIDTTGYFNSPLFLDTVITQAGGLVEWTAPISYDEDSVVYYWRVSPDSVDPQIGYSWVESSFIYINGSYPGWNQSHFFQYKKDLFKNVELFEPIRNFEYISSLQELHLTNGYTPNPLLPERLAFYLNGNIVDKCRCSGRNGVNVVVIDSSDLSIWGLDGPAYNTEYGALNCDGAGRTLYSFLFETRAQNGAIQYDIIDSLDNFLNNVIDDGFYVLAFTLNDAGADAWPGSNLEATLLAQGADPNKLNALMGDTLGLPFAFYFQKNTPSFIYPATEIALSRDSTVDISCLIPGDWYSGDIETPLIGPALEWKHVYWDHSTYDGIPSDITSVDIYGVDSDGTQSLLIANLVALDSSLLNIDAAQYPYLKMVWNSYDAATKSSPQLDYWRIVADMAPEAALRPDIHLVVQSDTIQQGQPLYFDIAMENISDVDMDSMLVKFQVIGSDTAHYQRIAALPSGDTLHTSYIAETSILNGSSHLLVEINPDGDQPEQYHFNNLGLYNFFVQRDNINPLMDVTFDGVRIMNGDIVSGQPEITIGLSDENRYLDLNDLEDFSVFLRHKNFPGGEISLKDDPSILFFPADPAKLHIENKARVEVSPKLVYDGIYTLFVSAKDRSNNNSGSLSYSVDFEVINKPSISNVLNYPNPFTTSTQFVFTLTGNELPDYMKIQVMTITGKVIREITMDELGPLHIGINRTEFAWDGTDQYGDRLANGVYLYRVVASRNGELYDLFGNNRVDHMFNRGFGKMYLMR